MDNVLNDMMIRSTIKMIMREYEAEKRIERRNRIYHNTFVLMKKYNLLKEHVSNIKNEYSLELKFEDLSEEDIWIMSIARSKMKTIQMIGYIDKALEILESKYKKQGIHIEYLAFRMNFIDNLSNEEIMKKLHCGKNSPKKWSDNVLNELGTLLWGYEALGID